MPEGGCLTCDPAAVPRYTSGPGADYCTEPYYDAACPSGECAPDWLSGAVVWMKQWLVLGFVIGCCSFFLCCLLQCCSVPDWPLGPPLCTPFTPVPAACRPPVRSGLPHMRAVCGWGVSHPGAGQHLPALVSAGGAAGQARPATAYLTYWFRCLMSASLVSHLLAAPGSPNHTKNCVPACF